MNFKKDKQPSVPHPRPNEATKLAYQRPTLQSQGHWNYATGDTVRGGLDNFRPPSF